MSTNDDDNQDSFECPNSGCERTFSSKKGAGTHAGQYCDFEPEWKNEETLRELYIDKELPIGEVADVLGCRRGAVQRGLDENDIETRGQGAGAARKARSQPANHTVDAQGYEIWQPCYRGEKQTVFVHQVLAIADGADPHEVFADETVVHHGPIEHSRANLPGNTEVLESQSEHITHHNTKYTDEELLDELTRLSEQLGGPPTVAEMNNHGKFNAGTYYNHFDSWTGAKERVGLSPPQTITEEALIAELTRVAEKLGKQPAGGDMNEYGEYSTRPYYDRFGSWPAALEAAGITSE